MQLDWPRTLDRPARDARDARLLESGEFSRLLIADYHKTCVVPRAPTRDRATRTSPSARESVGRVARRAGCGGGVACANACLCEGYQSDWTRTRSNVGR